MKLRICLLCAALLGSLPLAHQARAQSESSVGEAEQERAYKLYEEALKLYDRGRHKRALRKFLEVDSIMASPNARLYIGRCFRKLKRLPRAFEAMSAAVEIATKKAQKDPTYLRTRDAAAAEREQIAAEIGRIVVAAANPPPGLEIEVNSRILDQGKLGKQLGVTPGTVVVAAKAPDHEPFHHELEVSAGSVETIAVTMRREGTEGGVEEPSDGLRIGGFVTLGVGAAGMAVFAIAGLMANDRYAQIEDECGAPPCTDPSYEDLINEGKTRDLVANIGLGVGIAGLVAGTAMVIFGWPYEDSGDSGDEADEESDEESDEDEVEQAIGIDLGPDRAGLTYQLRF